ncbi:hypothetical protein LTR09_007084 [Extremus antarcticus]|uniref:Uncharacterized protein n=1 Tax=Extremus antarcticus TaxID=702011 RepID=A0AAJ0GD75_9PEZI|nr:hypothetical protein LTR09_007084 [Extremus antarcticus]
MFQDDGCENPPAQQGPPGLTLGAQPAFKPLDTRAAVIAGGTKHASLNRTSPLSHRFTLLNPPLATSRLSPITLRTKLQLKKGGAACRSAPASSARPSSAPRRDPSSQLPKL